MINLRLSSSICSSRRRRRRRRRRRTRMVKLKSSYFFVGRTCSQQNKVSKKTKLKHKERLKGVDDDNNTAINKLPNELLVSILSCMSLKEAARTSVVAPRWKYLWRSGFRTLHFDIRDVLTATQDVREVEKFCSWVDTVLELLQNQYIDGLVIRFERMSSKQYCMRPRISHSINNCVSFAVRKEVDRFELYLPFQQGYIFPSIDILKSLSDGVCSPFFRLRILRLMKVNIEDDVVQYLLASCPKLEDLCIRSSFFTKNLRVVDPPSLRVLEVMRCFSMESVEISTKSLVSLTYIGDESILLKNNPNLHELTIGDESFCYLIHEAKENLTTLHQLVKLVVDIPLMTSCKRPLVGVPVLPQLWSLKRLEVRVFSKIGRSLLFFSSLIKAAPQLCEFRIETRYFAINLFEGEQAFPAISDADAVKFDHTSLKVIEMFGYVGCLSANELLSYLLNNASSSVEKVVIDTASNYYDDPGLATCIFYNFHIPIGATTRIESIERAKHFISSTFPHHIKSFVS